MDKISSFTGKYEFLSNFYPCFVTYDGQEYGSAERAFQAAKTLDKNERKQFVLCATNAEAKRRGRHVKLRPAWETIKYDVMYEILKSKFSAPRLAVMLLNTGDAYLEEGNNHGDRIWGTVKGVGNNSLGKLLMEIRKELKEGTF